MSKLPDHEFKAWMESGKYLPPPLRDFHDQKDLFKSIHELVSKNEGTRRVNWVDAQIYVIDVFLWFMARRGYTLQRARVRYEFRDLAEDVAHQTEKRDQESMSMIGAFVTAKPQPDQPAQEVD